MQGAYSFCINSTNIRHYISLHIQMYIFAEAYESALPRLVNDL
jgi:hypothetical protein